MGMERRWGTRKTLEVDVVIDNQPSCLLRGRLNDISIGGLFVKVDTTPLRLNAPVELVMLLESDEGTRVYKLPAIVVRLTADGAGLMFDQYDVNAFRTLVVLLLEHQKSFHQSKRPVRRHLALATVSNKDDAKRADLIEEDASGLAAHAVASASVIQQMSPAYGALPTKKVQL